MLYINKIAIVIEIKTAIASKIPSIEIPIKYCPNKEGSIKLDIIIEKE